MKNHRYKFDSDLRKEKNRQIYNKANLVSTLERLDSIDIGIIKALIADPSMKSSDIASKLSIPSSTIQRRKFILESSSILRKKFELEFGKLGLREADLLIKVEKGRCREIAHQLLRKFKNSVRSSTLRIGDPEVNVVAEILYKSSPELLEIVENVKNMNFVTFVEWSEITEVVGRNNIDIQSLLSTSKLGNKIE